MSWSVEEKLPQTAPGSGCVSWVALFMPRGTAAHSGNQIMIRDISGLQAIICSYHAGLAHDAVPAWGQ